MQPNSTVFSEGPESRKMDTRAEIAWSFMHAMLSNVSHYVNGIKTPQAVAKEAFRYADAFIECWLDS